MLHPLVQETRITRYRGDVPEPTTDVLAVEEPLEISITFGPAHQRTTQNLSVTMRTPGHDPELCAGFLRTEGIISQSEHLVNVVQTGEHAVLAHLSPTLDFDPARLQRHFYTNSSCGVCGKTTVEAVKMATRTLFFPEKKRIEPEIIRSLPNKMRAAQAQFQQTGGIHASGLFDGTGNLLLLREDVGRHNALDKLIGCFLLKNAPILPDSILLLSGRASFELIQKAAIAGIGTVCAIGAPSSLAVETARAVGIRLIGFLKEDRFNCYD